jgi:hypothetical protein
VPILGLGPPHLLSPDVLSDRMGKPTIEAGEIDADDSFGEPVQSERIELAKEPAKLNKISEHIRQTDY